MPLRVAVLLSGGGTTLQNLLRASIAGSLPDVEFAIVISSNPAAGGLEFAAEAGIPAVVVRRKDFSSGREHSEYLFGHVRDHAAQLVVMAGYLEHLLMADDYQGRVINIHPSLIPAFSGKGYYGLRVHQAAVDYGVKLSGCSVHFVDNQYDHGPIIAQRSCPVLPEDTSVDLQRRVFELECELYPCVVQAIASGRIQLDGRRVLWNQ
jgi:phosphoribosylglycinamide formyltransferase 1